MGGGGVRGGCSPWGSGEDQLLGGGRIGVSGRKRPTSGPWICQTKEVTASYWEPAEEGRGGTGLEAFPLPGEPAPGCSWLLAGASNLAAAGDLDAWHSRAAGLFCCGPSPLCFLAAQPCPLHLALPLPPAAALGGESGHKGRVECAGGGWEGLDFSRGKGIPLLPPQLVLPPPSPPSAPRRLPPPRKFSPRLAGPWFYPGGWGWPRPENSQPLLGP